MTDFQFDCVVTILDEFGFPPSTVDALCFVPEDFEDSSPSALVKMVKKKLILAKLYPDTNAILEYAWSVYPKRKLDGLPTL